MLTNEQWLIVAGVGAFVVWGWWPKWSEWFNPASRENLIYQGANNAGAAATGNDDFSLGVWAWEASHDDQGNRHWTPYGVFQDMISSEGEQ